MPKAKIATGLLKRLVETARTFDRADAVLNDFYSTDTADKLDYLQTNFDNIWLFTDGSQDLENDYIALLSAVVKI